MKHFLEISQLSPYDIDSLLRRALHFKQAPSYPSYLNTTMVNLFYENSTRTRVSFELAAHKLSMTVINLHSTQSSITKGETLKDTLDNLAAMGIKLVVIRHCKELLQQNFVKKLTNIQIINAGDGEHAHPSQAMLDLMTIYEKKPNLAMLKVVIIGNVRHSRVANSLQALFKTLAIKELIFVTPDIWQPRQLQFGKVIDSLQEGISAADVIICLRIQQERLLDCERLSLAKYKQEFGLTKKMLKYAKDDAIILHPGPVNRDVEIAGEVINSKQSCILQQVSNGVFMRMAIIDSLLSVHKKL